MAKTACQSGAGFQRYKLLKSVMVLSGRSCEKNPVSGEDSRALRARRSLVTNCLHATGHFQNSQEQVIDCRDESGKASQYLFFPICGVDPVSRQPIAHAVGIIVIYCRCLTLFPFVPNFAR